MKKNFLFPKRLKAEEKWKNFCKRKKENSLFLLNENEMDCNFYKMNSILA